MTISKRSFAGLLLAAIVLSGAGSRPCESAEWQFENWDVVPSTSGAIRRSAPIRNMVRAADGSLLGTRSSGAIIELWRSTNDGKDWTRGANIAQSSTVEFGDPTLHVLPNGEVLAGFRERHNTLGWSVRVSRSTNNGQSWSFGGTIQDWTGSESEFVGAPHFNQLSNGTLQVYFDSELAATGSRQYIAVKDGTFDAGLSQWAWSDQRVVNTAQVASFAGVRDGLATVVNLGPDLDGEGDRLMIVTEGVGTRAGLGYNLVRAFQVENGGEAQADWDNLLDSRVIYQSPQLDAANHRFNAYAPYAIRVADGPVVVAFSTDEVLDEFGMPADINSTPPHLRHSEIKLIHTLDNFETWSNPITVWGMDHADFAGTENTGDIFNYQIGMMELAPNDLLATLDLFGGKQIVFRPSLNLQGDYDENGVVDAADYTLWRNTLGSTSDLTADGNNNGEIDAADYDVWRRQYGVGLLPPPALALSVPEPAARELALGVGIVWATLRLMQRDAGRSKFFGKIQVSYSRLATYPWRWARGAAGSQHAAMGGTPAFRERRWT